jgi:transposase InsO family protein
VWCADITYIQMRRGFLYLVAIMDWASRKVLAWRLSNTMDTEFCVAALEEAIARYGRPDIFNTDQGSQTRFKSSSQRSFLPSLLLHQKPQLAFASSTSSLAWS